MEPVAGGFDEGFEGRGVGVGPMNAVVEEQTAGAETTVGRVDEHEVAYCREERVLEKCVCE